MTDNTTGGAGDTLEFLRIMGASPTAPDADESQNPAQNRRGRADDDDDLPPLEVELPPFGEPTIASPMARGDVDADVPPEPEEAKPVVIKGGPRRVVRADGRQPDTSYALGQRRFALSSGHEMFAPKKRRNVLRDSIIAVVALVAVALVFVLAWQASQASVTQDKRESLVGTTQYDRALSLTPADDGGYYTVFFVTSTKTNENEIGTLSQVVMYRTDKATTTAMRIYVPENLYVAPNYYSDKALTLQAVLDDSQSLTRALQAVDDAFGIRLYNVVCCEQSVFDSLNAVLDGSASADSIEASSLLGKVRTNLTPENLVAFCGKVGSLDQAAIPSFTAPTTDLDVNGVIMAQGSAASFSAALGSVANYQVVGYDSEGHPIIAQYDDRGNYLGTQYDENGNPLLDENGVPQGALRTEDGSLYFDETGRLQFWGQQYDDRGNWVGTQYDENGNPILDEWGHPKGTQYTEDGSDYLYDWRGNVLIVNE